MKSLDQILGERRSIRAYDPQQSVDRKEIEQLIAAAIEAPSWKNKQTSRYHVVTSPEAKAKLMACLGERNQGNVADAPALVVTTFVKNIVGYDNDGITPTNELGNGWGLYDLGLSNMVFMLKAAELGLDTLVMGIRDADAISTALSLPADEVVVAVLGLGHRLATPERPPRKAVSDIARFY